MKSMLKNVGYFAGLLIVIVVARAVGGAAGRSSAIEDRAIQHAKAETARSKTTANAISPIGQAQASQVAAASEEHFQRVQLARGISIEVPRGWALHTKAEKENFAAGAEAAARNANLDYDTTKSKERLLAASSLPIPSAAKIRLNVIRPQSYSSAELRSASQADLVALQRGLAASMENELHAGGIKLISMDVPKVVDLQGHAALLISYERSDLRGPSYWVVQIYSIAAGNATIQMTLSFSKADAVVFLPVLEHVKRSLNLD